MAFPGNGHRLSHPGSDRLGHRRQLPDPAHRDSHPHGRNESPTAPGRDLSFRPWQQYTSSDFGATLKTLEIRQSVGRTGICYDCESLGRRQAA
jgi:hypothetical protein